MVKVAENTLNEVDIVLMLVDSKILGKGRFVISELQNVKTPVILVINKLIQLKNKHF